MVHGQEVGEGAGGNQLTSIPLLQFLVDVQDGQSALSKHLATHQHWLQVTYVDVLKPGGQTQKGSGENELECSMVGYGSA